MKKHVPTKLKDFFCEGGTWTRNVVPGRVRCGYWTAYLHEDGRIHSFGAVTEDAPCPQDSSFARSASRAITALWTTIDVPKVFRTKVEGESRSVRWIKGDVSNTVKLLGKWPMTWDTCRIHYGAAQAHGTFINRLPLNVQWGTAVRAAVEHFWGPELRHDHASSVGLRADEVWISTALQGVDMGRRNDTCHKLATYFFDKRLDKDVTTTQLLRFAGRCRPPLDPSEVVDIVDAVYAAPTPLPERWFKNANGSFQWVKGQTPNTVSKKWASGALNLGISWARSEAGPLTPGLEEAVDFYWPKSEQKKPISDGWSFTCAPDKVDIARCLREAYAAGFREVAIEWNNDTTVYFHREVWPLLAKSGVASQAPTWSTAYHKDWAPLPASYAGRLAFARAWEAAQSSKAPEPVKKVEKPKAPTVTVTLKGTR